MRNLRLTISCLIFLVVSSLGNSQDVRTIDTKIVDLLAQLPANSNQYTAKLMDDMIAMGDEGLNKICSQVIPAGTGDDTKPRFAIESLSRHLSSKGKESDRAKWEKICISFADRSGDPGVKDFFIKQLQMIGGDATIDALAKYLTDKEVCDAAVAAITSAGGPKSEQVLAGSLKNRDLPCASAVMNALASMRSKIAIQEYIYFTSSENINIKASAYHALAMSGVAEACPVLLKASADARYRWDPAGKVDALLDYAKVKAGNGDIKTMTRIFKTVMAKCNDRSTIQYRTAALDTYVSFYGVEAMPVVLKEAKSSFNDYRNSVINSRFAPSDLPGVIDIWIKNYPKAVPAAKPEIIRMLGVKKDARALNLILGELKSPDPSVRAASAEAAVKIEGGKAAPALIQYISGFTLESDQKAGAEAYKTAAGNDEIALLRPVLKNGPASAKKFAIGLMAWSKNPQYFADVFPFTASTEESVRSEAFKALPDLAGTGDQVQLILLLKSAGSPENVSLIQDALANAANKLPDPEKRCYVLLQAFNNNESRQELIPVLARTGGREALDAVMNEFRYGSPDSKAVCFKALTSWKDFSASSALYEICASGNKSYESQAFQGYVKQVRNADIPDEEKLLLLRKIMPYALSAEQKNSILVEAGKLRTYQSLFFVASYLDDPQTSAAAAQAAMTIALPSADSKVGMYGKLVREILVKAGPKITGSESDYDRENIKRYLASMPADEGFVQMFNGKDLTGWQGLVENPVARSKMKPAELAKKQEEANKKVPLNWSVKDGCIVFNGKGDNLCSIKEYGDFEMLVDWKITKKGDSGIYLRGSPQVQIWDTSRVEVGAQVGSGGLYNNRKNPSKPLKVADNPVGDWNTFRIVMAGPKVSVWLNGELVVDNVTLENYWDYSLPIFPKGPIELQAHGTDLAFRDIYVREISDKEYNLSPEEKAEGFAALFNGKNLDNWVGNKVSYAAEDGMIVIRPEQGSGGNLYTDKEFSDFIFRFEFQLTPGANNGIGIRAPLEGDAAYVGMEIQVLDNTADVYKNLQPYQYHGSVYGVIPAKREYLKPVGEWNTEEIMAQGTHIKVTLNGTVIVDGDIAGPRDNGTMDHNQHPGLKNKSGHIGFLGHGSLVKFRNIRIKEL